MTDEIDFSEALLRLKDGFRVRRTGWNGKGMWLTYVHATELRSISDFAQAGDIEMDDRYDDGVLYPMLPWIGMKTADGQFVPWLCSQTDMLALDWEEVPTDG